MGIPAAAAFQPPPDGLLVQFCPFVAVYRSPSAAHTTGLLLTPPLQPLPVQHVKAAVAKDGTQSSNNAAKRAAVCQCARMLTTTAVRS